MRHATSALHGFREGEKCLYLATNRDLIPARVLRIPKGRSGGLFLHIEGRVGVQFEAESRCVPMPAPEYAIMVVTRGGAARAAQEAARRGIPWERIGWKDSRVGPGETGGYVPLDALGKVSKWYLEPNSSCLYYARAEVRQ
jgi:hypothetical protein